MNKINVFRLTTLLCCFGFLITLNAQSVNGVAEIKGSINLDDKYEIFFGMLYDKANSDEKPIAISENGQFSWTFNIEEPQFVQVVIYPKAKDRQLAINFPLYVKPGTVSSLNLNYDDEEYLKLIGGNLSSENKALILYSNYCTLKRKEMFVNPPTEAENEAFLKSYINYPTKLIADLEVTDNSVKQFIEVWSLNEYLKNAVSLEYNRERGAQVSLNKYFSSLEKSPKEIFNYPEALLQSDSFRNMDAFVQYTTSSNETNMSNTAKVKNKFKHFSEIFSNEQIQQKYFKRELEIYLVDFKIDENTDFEKSLAEFSELTSYITSAEVRENLKADFAKRVYSIPGSPMPSVKFLDIDGNEVALESFKGNYIYIDLWASWCGPCIKEIPILQKLEHDYKNKNIVFLSVSVDESSNDWRKKVKELQLEGHQLEVGDSEFDKMMNVRGIPHFILYDNEGNLKLYKAPRPSSREIRAIFDEI